MLASNKPFYSHASLLQSRIYNNIKCPFSWSSESVYLLYWLLCLSVYTCIYVGLSGPSCIVIQSQMLSGSNAVQTYGLWHRPASAWTSAQVTGIPSGNRWGSGIPDRCPGSSPSATVCHGGHRELEESWPPPVLIELCVLFLHRVLKLKALNYGWVTLGRSFLLVSLLDGPYFLKPQRNTISAFLGSELAGRIMDF